MTVTAVESKFASISASSLLVKWKDVTEEQKATKHHELVLEEPIDCNA